MMKVKEILATALAFTTVIQSISTKRKFKVYNGKHITTWDDNPFRFMVMIKGQSYCTGSIFNSLTVISAGHCFMDPFYIPTFIALEHTGSKLNMAKTIQIDIAFVPVVYQTLCRKKRVSGEDISVVRLKRPINFHQVAHTRLLLSTRALVIRTDIILVGYGKDSFRQDGSGKLRKGYAAFAKCPFDVGDERIRAKTAKEFSNQHYGVGDSGAPLIIKRNGEYFTSGFLSGEIMSNDGRYFMIFSSYKRHEEFIATYASDN